MEAGQGRTRLDEACGAGCSHTAPPMRPHPHLRREGMQLGGHAAQQVVKQARVVVVQLAQAPDQVGQLLLVELQGMHEEEDGMGGWWCIARTTEREGWERQA